MPRIASKKKEYAVVDFRKWLYGELKTKGIRQADVAEWFGISQQATSVKIRTGNFDLMELLTIFEKLETDSEQIGKLLKV